MSKTIKFNLIVDGKSIRSLNDLKNNFNIDDIYDLYENGILKKWLDVRGYKKESEQLDQILAEKNADISTVIIGLIKIFSSIDENFNPKTEAYSQIFRAIKKSRLEEAKDNEFEYKNIIEQYHFDYEMLKESIIENNTSFDFIKSCVSELSEKFIGLFRLDYRQFYYEYIEKAPLAVFAVLMNNELRDLLLNDEAISWELSKQYSDIEVLQKLGDNLKTYRGSTQGMWQYIGQAGMKYLVIKLSDGACRVGEQHSLNIDISANEVNGYFKILDGLLFKSTSDSLEVVYLEV